MGIVTGIRILALALLFAAPAFAADDPAFINAPSVGNDPGHALPDPDRTPGATNPNVTPATIQSTICVPEWTRSAQWSAAEMEALKQQQLASFGYEDRDPGHYVEDSLIPVGLGGDPKDPGNLWPEPKAGKWSATVKDELEAELNCRVCLPDNDPRHLSLDEAQQDISVDWIAAYHRYVERGTRCLRHAGHKGKM